jgi:pimeloyl-ACP methyl ester carboxylesterase
VIAAFVLVFVLGLLMWNRLVERMIFYPSPGADLRPQALGIEGEEVFLHTEDGVRLHAFYLPAPGATRALLFLHGNAGNASHRLPNAAALVRLGTSVLLPDYRGYGLSEGTPSEKGCYADARAALAYLIEERGFREDRIVLFGRSLGGSVAVDLAQDRSLAGVILESTFTSAADVVKHSFGRAIAPLVGGMLASDRKIGRVRSPLLFFHGDRDEIIDYEIGRRLFEAAPEPKVFVTLAGAGHNDTLQRGGPAYLARIGSFLDEVAP